MTSRTPLALAALVAAAALSAVAIAARGEGPTTAPTTKPDAATLQASLATDKEAFESAMTSPELLVDPAARKAAAPKLVPAARKFYGDLEQMAAAQPEQKEQIDAAAEQMNTLLATFGDTDAKARLQAKADGKDAAIAIDAKGDQLLVQWWLSAKDPAGQAKVADAVTTLAKAHPENEPLTATLNTMSQLGSATPALAKQMQGLVADVMKNPTAEQLQTGLAADRKLAELASKPMVIKGTTVDGKPFTTADWKGKVVLVDFWATWCGPCKAELPRVEKMYADYHDKGLEVLAVSNDQSADDLKSFVKNAGDKMPWPQLFDAAAADKGSWNPITTGYGINGIPTMFLIDKNGVCRTVEAREQMEDLIPKMLAEK